MHRSCELLDYYIVVESCDPISSKCRDEQYKDRLSWDSSLKHRILFSNAPCFAVSLRNTLLSTVPGVSGAGATPEKTLLTPVLDAELITNGAITSHTARPDTPTGCPTPASITRAMMDLCGIQPVFINAGLRHTPTVPCFDIYGKPGEDPRFHDAVPHVQDLVKKGEVVGRFLSKCSDLARFG